MKPRLYSQSLPNELDTLRLLVNVYFERVAILRCFGFIHKPSFMQSFDRGSLLEDYGEALLLIISALGARYNS